jgi:hypothetical protein
MISGHTPLPMKRFPYEIQRFYFYQGSGSLIISRSHSSTID